MQLEDASTQKILPFIQSPKGAIPELEDFAGGTTKYETGDDSTPTIDLRQESTDEPEQPVEQQQEAD
jgi:hypothetical protein